MPVISARRPWLSLTAVTTPCRAAVSTSASVSSSGRVGLHPVDSVSRARTSDEQRDVRRPHPRRSRPRRRSPPSRAPAAARARNDTGWAVPLATLKTRGPTTPLEQARVGVGHAADVRVVARAARLPTLITAVGPTGLDAGDLAGERRDRERLALARGRCAERGAPRRRRCRRARTRASAATFERP